MKLITITSISAKKITKNPSTENTSLIKTDHGGRGQIIPPFKIRRTSEPARVDEFDNIFPSARLLSQQQSGRLLEILERVFQHRDGDVDGDLSVLVAVGEERDEGVDLVVVLGFGKRG